jgi:hypothetical protein
MSKNRFGRRITSKVALVGICAATIECGKLALSFLPNVEIVTLLCALYGYTFGVWGILSAGIFVCIEPLIWGFGTWVPSYLLYWPLVALVFMLLGRARVRSRVLLTLAAVVLSAFFGVLTSLIDVGLLSGYFDRFFYRFGIYYARGAVFYLIQIACNAVIFPLLFLPMHRLLVRVNK